MECHLLSDNHKDIYQPILVLGFIWQSGLRLHLEFIAWKYSQFESKVIYYKVKQAQCIQLDQD